MFTVKLAVLAFVSVSVLVPDDTFLIKVVTSAEFPVTVPVYVSPANGGVILVILKFEPVCAMEKTNAVPARFVLHFPEKSAGAEVDPSPPPPQAAITRPQQSANIIFIAFMSFLLLKTM